MWLFVKRNNNAFIARIKRIHDDVTRSAAASYRSLERKIRKAGSDSLQARSPWHS